MMEFLFLTEILGFLFYNYKNNYAQMTYCFDKSEHIALFDYNFNKKEFILLNPSFYKFLDIEKSNEYYELKTFSNFIHPHDLHDFNEYFNINKIEKRSIQFNNPNSYNILRCRLKHSNGFWKYLVFISFNYRLNNDKHGSKFGIICDYLNNNLSTKNNICFSPQFHLTKRECEVLECMSIGLITKEIAGKLDIEETTVITYRKNLLEKFKARNTAELIGLATKLMVL